MQVASGAMANVKQLADDPAQHADSLSAAIGVAANAVEPSLGSTMAYHRLPIRRRSGSDSCNARLVTIAGKALRGIEIEDTDENGKSGDRDPCIRRAPAHRSDPDHPGREVLGLTSRYRLGRVPLHTTPAPLSADLMIDLEPVGHRTRRALSRRPGVPAANGRARVPVSFSTGSTFESAQDVAWTAAQPLRSTTAIAASPT